MNPRPFLGWPWAGREQAETFKRRRKENTAGSAPIPSDRLPLPSPRPSKKKKSKERGRENSKTSFYEDFSLGSVKNGLSTSHEN